MADQPIDDHSWMVRLSDAERAELRRERRIVEWWEAAKLEGKAYGRREPEVTAGFRIMLEAIGWSVSRRTLFGWRRSYYASGLRGLHDERSPAVSKAANYEPFRAEFRELYLGPGMISIGACYAVTVERAKVKGWEIPTIKHCREYLKAVILPELRRKG